MASNHTPRNILNHDSQSSMKVTGCTKNLVLIQEKFQFSSLILTNQMTREEALEQLMKKPYDQENIRHEFEYIAKETWNNC